jgi:hypothetical protein
VTARAYAILLFHALKYPFAEVNGVLLAKQDDADSQMVTIVDAVPLFHQWTQLSAMLEIALQQVELYASQNKLLIIGYYHANEDLKEHNLKANAVKIADKIHANSGKKSVIFLVDNEKLDSELNEVSLLPFVHSQNQWQQVKDSFQSEKESTSTSASSSSDWVFRFENPDILARTRFLVGEKRYRHLVDFDNYLDNTEADWLRNSHVEL